MDKLLIVASQTLRRIALLLVSLLLAVSPPLRGIKGGDAAPASLPSGGTCPGLEQSAGVGLGMGAGHAIVNATTFENLAAAVGRADAWYLLSGYADAPLPAPSTPAGTIFPPGTGTITLSLTNTLYIPIVTRHYVPPSMERRAVWVTRYDWTSIFADVPPERIDAMVANIAEAGFNTIFFQVRVAGDAYYTPGLEPWSERLTAAGGITDTLGQDPGWDPLARMLAQAHAVGLEVHAYVNVYTGWLPPPAAAYGELAPPATIPPSMFDRFTYGPDDLAHPGQHQLGETWRQYYVSGEPMPLNWGTYLWASPGVNAVQEHIVAVVRDIVTRYPVDGVHLDRVRYAGPSYSYDPFSNTATGTMDGPARAQWQRDRVTALVRRISDETHALRPELWVSAAVWPYYLDEWGWGTSEGYADYYQDAKGWLATGALDAIAPMLYGSGSSIPDDFDRWRILMEDFVAASAGRHVYPGIAGYYADFGAIAQRIEAARDAGAPGHAIFSYGALERNDYWDDLAIGPYRTPAKPPATRP